ncbi:MAG: hypothetical protein B6D35_08685 [Candidatus Brocadia sp. UTAMX2]|jgi:hypothetical protein|nr:MAG: hypothetical protein B6D35_08685 [Candidatus Brocadia sp. UTAMX2]
MNKTDRRLWPFGPRTIIISAIAILLGLVLIYVALRVTLKLPSQENERMILIGMFLFGLLPIVLALVDVFIERGGVIEYRGVKIDFSQIQKWGGSEITVSDNMGLPNQPVNSSSMPDILKTLRESMGCDVVIIDLKDGEVWRETLLLVLLAGAVRLKKPEKVVFIGKDSGIDKYFQGWSHPHELLPRLLKFHPQYQRSFHAAQAAARKRELVEPVNPVNPSNPGSTPPIPDWMNTGLVVVHNVNSFDKDGLPEEMLAERLLAYDLWSNVESKEGSKRVSLVRLEELFRPVLYKESIDESWKPEHQMEKFFEINSDYFAVTQNGTYSKLVSRLTVLNTITQTLVEKKQA